MAEESFTDDDEGEVACDEDGVDTHPQYQLPAHGGCVGKAHGPLDEPGCGLEDQRQGECGEEVGHVVGNRLFLLAYEVAQEHGGAVAGETSPRTGYVAVFGNEGHVDAYHHSRPDEAYECSPPGLVAEFVPERQVEEDAHEDFRHHHYRYDLKAGPIAACTGEVA